jgi:hypothetical protein
MIKKLSFVFVLLVFLLAWISLSSSQEEIICNQDYVLVTLLAQNESLLLVDKSLENGCFPNLGDSFAYEYKLVDGDNSLESGSFDPNVLFVDGFESGEMTGGAVGFEGEIYLAVPYFEESEDLRIYKQGNEIFSTKIYDVGGSCKYE